MKKLFLAALLSAIFTGSTFAQFVYNATAANNAIAGITVQATNLTNKDTIQVHFNTNKALSAWAPAKTTVNIGKDSIAIFKATTQKGIQVKAYLDGTTLTNYASGSFKSDSYTANGNPVHVSSLTSLLAIMSKSYVTGTINGSTSDSLTRPATCLFDVAPGNSAFGMYPGKCKRIEYGAYFNFSGKAVKDDITFDISTLGAGTTGKTASYELSVFANTSTLSTFTADTYLVGRVTNIYTTSDALKTINLSTVLGKTPNDFSNKYVYIFLKTKGTTNDLGVVDGIRNAVDANNIPVVYDPTIVLDNFYATYGTASWVIPAGATATSYFDHNNGTPILNANPLDFTGGTPVQVTQNIPTAIKIYVSDINRIAAMTIKEANSGAAHYSQYSFAPTGAIMAKAGDGTYSIPVTYTNTPSDGTTSFYMTVPAPTSGTVTDDLEISLIANIPSGTTVSERLEISNGVLFRYTVGATGADLPAPAVTASTSALSGMDYTIGAGPSAESSFTVSGANLSSAIMVTPPANFEISKGTGAAFSALTSIIILPTTGTVAETTIYARLKAGLTANTYAENITVASTGVATQNISCSATIIDPQNLTVQVGQNGTVSENSVILTDGAVIVVNKGTSKTFTFAANLGYEVATLTFNGVDVKSQISGGQYVATVTATSTLVVTYKKLQFVLSMKDASTGTINMILDYGTTPAFSFTATSGWQVSTVFYNEVDVTSSLVNGLYTAPAIIANALLNVTFVSTPTGAPQMINSNVKVYTSQSEIIVEGAAEGEVVSLYTVNGAQTQRVISNGERMVIPAIKDAVYLVKTATKTFKVIL